MTHSIRLREPWQPLTAAATPSHAVDVDSVNSLEFIRKFNSPTGLTAQQTICLELSFKASIRSLAVHLNAQPIAPLATSANGAQVHSHCFDLREHLQPSNQLRVLLELTETSHSALAFGDLCEARLVLGDD